MRLHVSTLHIYNKGLGDKGRITRHGRFCYKKNKTLVMGDEVHAILNCAHFDDIIERFIAINCK